MQPLRYRLDEHVPYLFNQRAGVFAEFAKDAGDTTDDRLMAKAYAEGTAELHFHPLEGLFSDDGREWCVTFKRQRQRDKDFLMASFVGLIPVLDLDVGPKFTRDHENRNQKPVLVLNIELMDSPEFMVVR